MKMPNTYNFMTIKQENIPNYKKKLKNLKRFIKDLVLENAALCDQVAQVQENILIAKEERKYLLRKLYQYEPHSDLEAMSAKWSGSLSHSSSRDSEHRRSRKRPHSDSNHEHRSSSSNKSRKFNSRMRKKVVQQIPLDSTGRPVFPIELGNLTVHSLGEVLSERPEFHTEEVIYPVGYVSTRLYGSLKNPRVKCIYTCKISDNNGVPRFDITADNDLDVPIIGSTPDICHSLLLQHINESVQMEVVNLKPRGNDFFGLSHPTILNLIQSSPGTRKCSNYKWTKFEVGRNPDMIEERDASINFEALQRNINFGQLKTVQEIKEEPPDELMEHSSGTLRELLMS